MDGMREQFEDIEERILCKEELGGKEIHKSDAFKKQ